MELEYARLPRTSGATADALLDATSAAIPVLEAAGDDRCLGRAWLLAGWVHGGRRGQHKAREDAAEEALRCYKRTTWPASLCAGEIANALYYGPSPVAEAIDRCESLLRTEVTTRFGRANVERFSEGSSPNRATSIVPACSSHQPRPHTKISETEHLPSALVASCLEMSSCSPTMLSRRSESYRLGVRRLREHVRTAVLPAGRATWPKRSTCKVVSTRPKSGTA